MPVAMDCSLSRRMLLLSLSTVVRPATSVAQPSLPSLRIVAEAAGLHCGTNSDVRIVAAMPGYAALLARQCDLFAPNLSWATIAGKQGAAEPAREDPNIAFARTAGMKLTGGHLLWYLRMPDWFAGLDQATASRTVETHIAQVAGRYTGQVYSWNVVNEAIDTRQGDANGMRETVLTRKLGPDYITAAFRNARASDPQALLLYNDGLFEMATNAQAARRDALFRLLDRLQRDGAPIDGVGLQSHLVLDGAVFDPTIYQRFLHDIAGRGLKIVLTELDVQDKSIGPDLATRDAAVAARYTAFLDVALAEPAVKAVVLWGLSDRYTWLTTANQSNLGRPDGLPTRPLPFDADLNPKVAFFAILEALRRAPKRSV